MKLFEYAIIYHHALTKEDRDQGKTARSVLIQPITPVLARDEKEVMILAARSIPETHTDKLDQVEIAIRPF